MWTLEVACGYWKCGTFWEWRGHWNGHGLWKWGGTGDGWALGQDYPTPGCVKFYDPHTLVWTGEDLRL